MNIKCKCMRIPNSIHQSLKELFLGKLKTNRTCIKSLKQWFYRTAIIDCLITQFVILLKMLLQTNKPINKLYFKFDFNKSNTKQSWKVVSKIEPNNIKTSDPLRDVFCSQSCGDTVCRLCYSVWNPVCLIFRTIQNTSTC